MTKLDFANHLKNILKPQNKTDQKKIIRLEQLLVKYILVRLMEDMDELNIKKFERHAFDTLADLMEYLRNEIPELENNVEMYIHEFTQKYVRNI